MARILMYTTDWCGYCHRAKSLLDRRGLAYEEVKLDMDPRSRQRLLETTGGWTVPQIVIDDEPIGGYVELSALERSGALDGLVSDVAVARHEG